MSHGALARILYTGLSILLVNSGKINVEYIEDLEGHRKQWVNDDIYYMLGRGGRGYFSCFEAIIKNEMSPVQLQSYIY